MFLNLKVHPSGNRKSAIEKRRQKISSPTIDSTSDNICHTTTQEMIVNSQDSHGVSSTHKVNGKYIITLHTLYT